MHLNKRKEDFSLAIVRAVAATCGWAVGDWSQDMDCIDTTIQKTITAGEKCIPVTCDFQLKCTESPTTDNSEYVSFSLDKDHFEKLKNRIFGPPFILCVVIVPPDKNDWYKLFKTEEKQLHFDSLLQHCGYARLLYDHENLLDDKSKTIRFIKDRDELSVENLTKLESLLGSPEYNLARAKAEQEFWNQQQS